MRIVVVAKDADDVLADTRITVRQGVRLEFNRPPTAVRISIVKDGPADRQRTLCLIFE